MCPEMYIWSNTVLFASANEELKESARALCSVFGKNIFQSEPGSSDIMNIPCFCIIADAAHTGVQQWQTLETMLQQDETLRNIPVLNAATTEDHEILEKLREIVLQQIGIVTVHTTKKHEITIRQSDQPEDTGSPIAFDTMAELRNALIMMNACSLTLGSVNRLSGKPAIKDFGISPDKLDDSLLNWIATPDKLHKRMIFV